MHPSVSHLQDAARVDLGGFSDLEGEVRGRDAPLHQVAVSIADVQT
jgi:hypothetical protein